MRKPLLVLLFGILHLPAFATDRVVFPQAAVGPIGGEWYELELRLGNRDPNLPWKGTVRLLRQSDLSPMTGLRISGPEGLIQVDAGGWSLDLAPNSSQIFRVGSEELQVGVMTIEGSSDVNDLVPSFFYRLRDQRDDSISDLIAIQPARSPALAYDTMISRTSTFRAGLAMVADQAIDTAGGSIPTTQVTLTVVAEDGEEFQGVVILGGDEPAQKAAFPDQLISGLPQSFESARLHLAASDPVYVTLLGVGTPPLFQDIQIGAVPPQVAASATFLLRDGWRFVAGADDLMNNNFWECAGSRITQYTGGFLTSAGTGWESTVNQYGSFLEIDGDFGVLVSLDSSGGEDGYLSALGRPATGPEWWRGLRRLDFGVSDGRVVVMKWDGSPDPDTHAFLDSGSLSGETSLELVRQGNEFGLYARGVLVGTLPDFELTQDGRLYLGSNIPPRSSLSIFGVAATEPDEETVTVRVSPSPSTSQVPERGDSLRKLSDDRGIRIGAAVSHSEIPAEEDYRNTLGGEFNTLTAENVMKWGSIHPARDRYSFCPADSLVAFAEANEMDVRGHVLVWHQQNPAWLTKGNFERDEMIGILKDHIFTVAGRYRGRIAEWDVVNEAVEGDGSLRQTVWLEKIGPEYLELAFQWARQAAPDAKLFYNDYSAEEINSKSNAIYALLEELLDRGVPIDGIGFQAHIGIEPGLRPSKSSVFENLQRFSRLGLEISFTEIDVRIREPVTERKFQEQAVVYREMMEACLDVDSCVSFVTWGLTDKHSWVPGIFTGFTAPLLFDSSYNPKPAYHALVEVLTP